MLYHARFDILIKYICLSDYVANGRVWSKFTRQLYEQHLEIMTSGTFREKERSKSGKDKYLEIFGTLELFSQTTDSIAQAIPSDLQGNPLDGAHRIACAMLHNRRISLVANAQVGSPNYSFDWFCENNFAFNGYIINRILDEFPTLRLAIVWPSTEMQHEIVHRLPSKYIVKKVEPIGEIPHNTVVNAYLAESWLGKASDGYPGANDKVACCFTTPQPIQIVLFDAANLDVFRLKEELRLIAKVDKHSIHITDDAKETREKANIFLCSDFQDWATFTKLNSNARYLDRLSNLKDELLEAGFDKRDFVLTKGASMEVFSLRQATDMDVVSFKRSNRTLSKLLEVEYLDKTQMYEGFFEYRGIYCWSFNRLLADRLSKDDEKSREDVRLLRGELKRSIFFRLQKQSRRQKQILRRKSLNLLVDLGVYEIVRNIYRRVK